MGTMVQINSLDDLKRIMYIQKTITMQAQNELIAAANDTQIDPSEDPVKQAKKFMAEETRVLEKYAKYPTLSEFTLSPNLAKGTKGGATFGVTLLVGELIFEQIKLAHPHFSEVIRKMYMVFLTELKDPKHKFLLEPIMASLKYTPLEGSSLSPKEQKAQVQGMVVKLVDSMVVHSESYGLVKVIKGGVLITPTGVRVLMHLIDAAKFMEDLTQSHAQFKNNKPKWSMS